MRRTIRSTAVLSHMRPRFILTVNRRFVPASEDDSYSFGVVGFVLQVARALAARGQLCGLIMYRRETAVERPTVKPSTFLGCPGVELGFHFAMSRDELRGAFARAIDLLTVDRTSSCACSPVVIYHQTNTLLSLTPPELPFLVTHHGPFASEIDRLFGRDLACDAFQGGAQKLDHLIASQASGVDHLRQSRNGAAVELSTVQEAVLRAQGVTPEKVWRIAPPLSASPAPLDASCVDDHGALHLVTATARIDAFKNLSRLVAVANRLDAAGVPVRVSMFVGGAHEDAERAALRAALREPLRAAARVEQRLPHRELMRFFARHRQQAIFVCTSVYETFGITPLEAILAGMTTLVPDAPAHVGIAGYLGASSRVDIAESSLVDRLLQLHRRGARLWLGNEQRDIVLSRVGPERCLNELTAAAARVCQQSSPTSDPIEAS
jgi:hypothetical protein